MRKKLTIVSRIFRLIEHNVNLERTTTLKIRKLTNKETAPMALLLLADPSIEVIQGYLDQGDCYVVEADNLIIATYVLLPLDQQRIELKNLAVDPREQGQGIGQLLLSHAIESARRQGFKQIEVGTGNSSIGPLALYRKMGFVQTSIDKNFFIRHYPAPIFENGVQCRDLIRLSLPISQS